MRTSRSRLRLLVRLAAASGFFAPWPLVTIAVVTVLAFANGRIESVGPLFFAPPIPSLLLVPVLLAVSVGICHGTWETPVVRRGRRVLLARAASYGAALVICLGVVGVASVRSEADVGGGLTRNALWMSGVTMATATLIGVAYAWLPVVTAAGAAVLSPATDEAWTLYGFVLRPEATPGQMLASALLCGACLALAIVDPPSRGYLRTSGPPRPRRALSWRSITREARHQPPERGSRG